MPLVKVDATGEALTGIATMLAALEALPPGDPVVVMIHGYKFSPACPRRTPHRHILSLAPDPGLPRVVSWPRHLRLDDSGLAIAFGWEAAGLLPAAYARAATAGRALARLLARVAEVRGEPAQVIAHSLGARVALAALPHLPVRAAGRMVLMHPAELRGPALSALETPAGRAAAILSVTGRENDLFDALFEWGVAPLAPGARSVGAGLSAGNWIDLRIDRPEAQAALAALGHRIGPAAGNICHWSGYLRPGVFPLYRAVLDGRLPMATLRAAVSPAAVPPPPMRTLAALARLTGLAPQLALR